MDVHGRPSNNGPLTTGKLNHALIVTQLGFQLQGHNLQLIQQATLLQVVRQYNILFCETSIAITLSSVGVVEPSLFWTDNARSWTLAGQDFPTLRSCFETSFSHIFTHWSSLPLLQPPVTTP